MMKKILAVLAMLYAAASFAAVDVNKATAAELDNIKGIGPSISTKILDERKKGSFKDWEDFIARVRGIGEGNAEKFSAEGLTVNGSAFKAVAATRKDEKAAAKSDKKVADKKVADKKTKDDAKMAKADSAKAAAAAEDTKK